MGTKLERDEQISRWVELIELKRISAQPEPKSVRRPESGVNAAAYPVSTGGQQASAQRYGHHGHAWRAGFSEPLKRGLAPFYNGRKTGSGDRRPGWQQMSVFWVGLPGSQAALRNFSKGGVLTRNDREATS